MASQIDICNLALTKLGDTNISSITQNARPAKLLNQCYELMLEEVLRAYDWNFATGRAQLARLDEDPIFGYDFQYSLPADYLKIRKFFNAYGAGFIRPQYEIEGRKLLTNEETVQIIYTKKITDTTYFDSLFISAFAARLALEICESLTGKSTLKQILYQEYQIIMAKASATAYNEDTTENDAPFIGYYDARL